MRSMLRLSAAVIHLGRRRRAAHCNSSPLCASVLGLAEPLSSRSLVLFEPERMKSNSAELALGLERRSGRGEP